MVIGVTAVAAQTPDVDALRDRLDAYLTDYEPRLSELVAEETLKQHDLPARNVVAFRLGPPENRTLVSEVSFSSLPGQAGWLGFRRVIKVDGRPLPDTGVPLADLLSDTARADVDQAHLLLAESAKLNLGAPRTTNLPNLPLELLHPRHRSQFTHRIDGAERIGRIETTRVVLEESGSPTIVQRAGGGDMRSRVTAWIEPATGRLLRAQVNTRDVRPNVPAFDGVVSVDFRDERALGMLVPAEMRESFYTGPWRDGFGAANYSKYRKFQTRARIVPPSR